MSQVISPITPNKQGDLLISRIQDMLQKRNGIDVKDKSFGIPKKVFA